MGQLWDEARDATVVDKAVVETMLLRETLFALGDPALIDLADTLLLNLGRATRRRMGCPAARAASPAMGAACAVAAGGPRLAACATSTA